MVAHGRVACRHGPCQCFWRFSFCKVLVAHDRALIGTDRARVSGHHGLIFFLSFLIFGQFTYKKKTQNKQNKSN